MSTAKANPHMPALGLYDDGSVDVRCWCEAAVINIPRAVLMEGRTGSCVRLCGPETVSMRAPKERRSRVRWNSVEVC